MSVAAMALLAPVFLCWIAFCIIFNVVMYFTPFVMYRERSLAMAAFREVLNLIASNPAPFILFCLFANRIFVELKKAD